jgi:hypothetical protein
VIPGVSLPDSQVPFINPATGLVNRDWYRFLEAQFKYFGTMANQDADDVDITGGTITGVTYSGLSITGGTITGSTINSSVIGGTTPAAATFTTLAFSSGPIQVLTYTPTIVDVANIDSSSANDFFAFRVGDRASVGLRLTINPTAGGGAVTEVTFTLPWASTFADVGQCCGSAVTPSSDAASIFNDAAGTVGRFQFASGFTTSRVFRGVFNYLIV